MNALAKPAKSKMYRSFAHSLTFFTALTTMTDALANVKPMDEGSELLSPWLTRVSVRF
jgi:hypothetical protein